MQTTSDSNNNQERKQRPVEGIRVHTARRNGALVRSFVHPKTTGAPRAKRSRVLFGVAATALVGAGIATALWAISAPRDGGIVKQPFIAEKNPGEQEVTDDHPVWVSDTTAAKGKLAEASEQPNTSSHLQAEPKSQTASASLPLPEQVAVLPQEPTPPPQVEPVVPTIEQPTITTENCAQVRNSFPVYADPNTQVERIEREMRSRDAKTATLLREIACMPHVTWLVGGSINHIWSQVRSIADAAGAQQKIPVFVLYNIPDTHEPRYHSIITGGDYYDWVGAIGDALAGSNAWVIVEPDSLITARNYAPEDKDLWLRQMAETVRILTEKAPNANVYVDAGHSKWATVDETVGLLEWAGVGRAHGFSLNISNYHFAETQIAYGNQIAQRLGGKQFIVDTSRNGIGPAGDYEWCNAPDRALGGPPVFNTGHTYVDALLWIKPPGESDGWCNGGPQAGDFWLEYALDLVNNRN